MQPTEGGQGLLQASNISVNLELLNLEIKLFLTEVFPKFLDKKKPL